MIGDLQMLVNEVVVFPDSDTLEYLESIFESCPFNIDLSTCYVALNESWNPQKLDPNARYVANAGDLNYWYDDSIEGSSLIMPLESTDLMIRMNQLRQEDGYVFHEKPLAFMPLLKYMPPLNRRYRNFVVSVSDILHNSDRELVFTGETQRLIEVDNVPYQLYYESNL